MRVGIVGAGIAGLACAHQLTRHGLSVSLFDKGKRPGGRLASVAIDDMAWDLGALSFIAEGAEFRRQAARWREAGWLTDRRAVSRNDLVGVPTMAALVAAQCRELDVRFGARVHRIDHAADGWHVAGSDFAEGPFSALVIAVPAEQAAALLSLQDFDMARPAAAVRSSPCWTVMAAFSEPVQFGDAPLGESGPFATVSRSRTSPGRAQIDCWTLQANANWSRAHLERPQEEVADLLIASFAELAGGPLPPTSFAKAHRWRFAIPYGAPGVPLWNERLRLGACGDWCLGSTVEAAWLSGNRLGPQVAQAVTGSVGANAA